MPHVEDCRKGGYMVQAIHGSAVAANARRGQVAKWTREVDPDGTLPADERARRVEARKNAHAANMRAAKAKKRAATANEKAGPVAAGPASTPAA